MRKSLLAAVAAFATITITPAHAETVTVKVSHGDLDLSRADHVDVLKTRIDDAATKACRARSTRYSGWKTVDQSCVREATAAALAAARSRIPSQVASIR